MFAGAAVGKAQAMKAEVEQYNAAADAINRRVVETLARLPVRNWMPIHGPGSRGGRRVHVRLLRGAAAGGERATRRLVRRGEGRGGQSGNHHGGPSSSFARGSTSCLPVGTARCKRRGSPVLPERHRCGRRPVPDQSRKSNPVTACSHRTRRPANLHTKRWRVTTRQPSPLIRVTVSGEEILATRGHPLWVVGKRWVMAKHIQAGDLLHTVFGPLPVERVDEVPAPAAWYEFAYNLQVEGFQRTSWARTRCSCIT